MTVSAKFNRAVGAENLVFGIDKSGDALDWGLAFIEVGIGIMMIRTGRTAWLNLELGGQS